MPSDDPGSGTLPTGGAAEEQLRFGGYLLGLEGLALLRSAATGQDPQERQRAREMVRILGRLDEPALAATKSMPGADVRSGYSVWAGSYDERDNPLITIEEPAILPLLADLPPGAVLDAACGTGRLTAHVAQTHDVIGVDGSPEMLDRAREKLPSVEFIEGDLRSLPLSDGSVSSAVCALALSHLPELLTPMAELARVVEPGGRVVVSNPHPFVTGVLGWKAWFSRPDGSRSFIPEYAHMHSAYFEAFAAARLEVRRCLEPPIGRDLARAMAEGWAEDAAELAAAGAPGALIWELVRRS